MTDAKATSRTQCECPLCVQGRAIAATIASRDVDRLIKLVRALVDERDCLGFDDDYSKCVLDGSWPQSVEILERALATAKLRRVEEANPPAVVIGPGGEFTREWPKKPSEPTGKAE